ncbi:hypothetical protein Ddc_10099 [Ditylenchus destructor]|nr:hypothetical protein Ddc_10099 [Ditylenchus destructor]
MDLFQFQRSKSTNLALKGNRVSNKISEHGTARLDSKIMLDADPSSQQCSRHSQDLRTCPMNATNERRQKKTNKSNRKKNKGLWLWKNKHMRVITGLVGPSGP